MDRPTLFPPHRQNSTLYKVKAGPPSRLSPNWSDREPRHRQMPYNDSRTDFAWIAHGVLVFLGIGGSVAL